MSRSTPVVRGDSGIPRSGAPAFRPLAPFPGPSYIRTWPAAVRLLLDPPNPSATPAPRVGKVPTELLKSNPDLRAWLRSGDAWTAPTAHWGWDVVQRRAGHPVLTPAFVARLKLPEDISMDYDVLIAAAWAQGVRRKYLRRRSSYPNHSERVLRGILKIHASPWVALSLAAKHMGPVGVVMPDADWSTTCHRMEQILKHPYSATDGELPYILRSDVFKAAYECARRPKP